MTTPATAHDYAILGLRPSATMAEVENAFQRLALENHPDRSERPRAAERFEAITTAYDRIRSSGAGRIYRPGDAQPEDTIDTPRPGADFIPFEHAAWQPPAVAPTIWQRIRPHALKIEAAVAIACLIVAGTFLMTRFTTDRNLLDAYNGAPTCDVLPARSCILQETGTVQATSRHTESPLFGQDTESVLINTTINNATYDTSVAEPDGAPAFGGLSEGSPATIQYWKYNGAIVGVATPAGIVLTTNQTPTVIASRDLQKAWAWIVIGVLLGIPPALGLGSALWRRHPAPKLSPSS